jgi:hypothetical protein
LILEREMGIVEMILYYNKLIIDKILMKQKKMELPSNKKTALIP